MEFIFEFIFQIIGEILIQIVAEFLARFGIYSLGNTLERSRHPILSAIGFSIWGALAGVISLWFFPKSLVHDPTLRELNVLITPVIIATIMMLIGNLRGKRGYIVARIDRFGYGGVFAFTMAVVRYFWAG